MQLYRYYEGHGTGETGVVVPHPCGHETRYSFGGSAAYFQAPRQGFAATMRTQPCPECAVIAYCQGCPPVEPIHLRVVSSTAGEGWLTTTFPAAPGTLLFVRDDQVLQERHITCVGLPYVAYTYAARVFEPPCSYLHRAEEGTYTPEQLAWVDDYYIQCQTDPAADSFHRYYHFGASFQTPHQLAAIQERLREQGKQLYLSSTRRAP